MPSSPLGFGAAASMRAPPPTIRTEAPKSQRATSSSRTGRSARPATLPRHEHRHRGTRLRRPPAGGHIRGGGRQRRRRRRRSLEGAGTSQRELAHRGHPGRSAARRRRPHPVHDAARGAPRGRRDPGLRTDTVECQPGAGPRAAARRGARARQRDQGRPGRDPGVDDVPRDDARAPGAAARGVRPRGGQGLQPRVLARARGSGQRALHDPQHAEGGRRAHRRVHGARGRRLPAGLRDRRPRLDARRSPSWRSCWRTSSAASTSRSSTSWRSCATG